MGLGALTTRLCSPDGSRGRAPPVPTELQAPTGHPLFVQMVGDILGMSRDVPEMSRGCPEMLGDDSGMCADVPGTFGDVPGMFGGCSGMSWRHLAVS